MAAGPADAFSATPRAFGCYDRELIADNLWSSSVVATASTGASWVDEVHNCDPTEKRFDDVKRKFHRGRVLQIKHLPREVTEEEVREVLADWDVQTVQVQSGSARVSLCSPEVLEDWDRNAVFTIRGQRVTIVPSPTEMLLCVGKLPLSYNEHQFNCLVSSYGEIRRAFLMISERTGESKGYGFMEYVTKEAALQAKNALDGKRILDCIAVCDWLDSSHVTVRSLHSKCLYVDRLPPNYRDMGEFRRVFSTIVNPPYCQIALKNGCPQDWGLVEFINEDDAEKTHQNLDGYTLHGSHIRVAYYIPGVRAINLYLKLLNDGGTNKGRSALLPDPPAPAVFQQLQSLAKQNPVFAQNLQSIIMQQIQDLQKGKGVMPDCGKRPLFQKGPGGSPSFNSQHGNSPSNHNLLKNAQQTALTLLLASQVNQNGNNGQMSSQNMALQNQQLLAALQGLSKGGGDQFLNGIPGLGPSGHNLGALLGLASQPNGMGPLSPTQHMDSGSGNMSHNFYQQGSHSSPGSNGSPRCMGDDQWSYKSSRSTPMFGSNGMKTPLLPCPSGLGSPQGDVPMDTGNPKTPPGGDSLQAVWYSLFGHSSSSDSTPTSPGTSSPLFMKGSSNSGSPIGRNADALFGVNNYMNKSSPPGFHAHSQNRGMNGDLQEAISTLLNNPQNFSQILGGGQSMGTETTNPFSSAHQRMMSENSQGQRHSHLQPQGMDQAGVPNALLDLLMQSMKGEQAPEPFGNKQNAWSTGNPPSPIGNRGYNQAGLCQPQRSGSNGSSEMSSSSPRSPTYSPFSRNSNKGLLESGNGNASPTSTWNHVMLGSPSPTQSGGYIGGAPQLQNSFSSQSRSIWGVPSVSPGATSLNNNMMNLGIKRKVNHETNQDGEPFLGCPPVGHVISGGQAPHSHNLPTQHGHQETLNSQYADSYFKKKKKH